MHRISKIGHDDSSSWHSGEMFEGFDSESWQVCYQNPFPLRLNTPNINHGLVGDETAYLGPNFVGVFNMNRGWD